jgi:SAM-dependent methyltransferase
VTKFLHRVFSSVRQQGLGGTLAKIAGTLPEKLFDAKYSTDTCTRSNLNTLTIASENRAHGTRYEPTRVLSLQKLLPTIRRMAPADSVLVDLGCGKGRVLLLAARAGFPKVRGLEFASELCDVARRNCSTFKAKTGVTATFDVIHADVTKYAIQTEENVFFLFNPFDVVIFEQVLLAVLDSWRMSPRRILMVICLPTADYRKAIELKPELVFLKTIRCWGYDFYLYEAREFPTAQFGNSRSTSQCGGWR